MNKKRTFIYLSTEQTLLAHAIKTMTFYTVLQCDYIWNVSALLQRDIYGLSKIWDAVQDWIDSK